MDLQRYAAVLWKWTWLVVLSAIIAGSVAYWYSSRLPRVYRAGTTLMVGYVLQNANPGAQDFATGERLAQTYAVMVERQPVLDATVKELGLKVPWQSLVGSVHARSIQGTQLLEISVVGTDPSVAAAIADEIARQVILQSPTRGDDAQQERRTFIRQQLQDLESRIQAANQEIQGFEAQLAKENSARGVQDIQGQINAQQQKISIWRTTYANLLTFDGDKDANRLSIVERASADSNPISPNTSNNVMLAAIIGMLLAAGGAALLEYLDNTLKTEEEAVDLLGLPVLGLCARIKNLRKPTDHIVTIRQPTSPVAETFRMTATNLRQSRLASATGALLVTSAAPGEGKTTVACNLAVAFAQSGKRVILCDGDLRQPSVHRYFGVAGNVGLSSLISYDAISPEVALLDGPVPGLKIMPAGVRPANPTDLLSSEELRARVQQLKELADIVIFDSAPILAVADTSILGALCDRAIFVIDAGRTRRDAAQRAKAVLEQIGLIVSGVVLNKVATGSVDYYSRYASTVADDVAARKRRRLISTS